MLAFHRNSVTAPFMPQLPDIGVNTMNIDVKNALDKVLLICCTIEKNTGKPIKKVFIEDIFRFIRQICKFRSTGTLIPKLAVRPFRSDRYKYFG